MTRQRTAGRRTLGSARALPLAASPAIALAMLAGGLVAGCASNRDRSAPRPRQIVASDFSNNSSAPTPSDPSIESENDNSGGESGGDVNAAPAGDGPQARQVSATDQATQVGGAGSSAGNIGALDSHESAPAPASMSLEPLQPGEPYVIDRLIGQINGRPIFADEFFAPVEDRLIAARRTMNTPEFVQEVESVVDRRLQEVALNELFVSEAQAALTPEEQMGLSRWQRAVREILLARSSGIEGEAEQRLQEEGVSLDQRLMAIKDEALVRRLIERKITPRVIVSWRDIEREYRRRFQDFNPPGQIRFTRIVVATEGNEELVNQIRSQLQTDSFEGVIKSLSGSLVSQWGPFTLRDGKIENLPIVDEALRSELAGLTEHQTKGPLVVGRYTWWLHVDSIEQPTSRSVYDPQVQRTLYLELLQQRQIEEQNRYIDSLFQKGVYDDMDMMRSRLLRVALLRYGR